MNTPKGLSKRLLKLYPVKIIKDHFQNSTGAVQDELIEDIVKQNSTQDILDFCMKSINRTKQHIYIFDLNKEYKKGAFPIEHFPITPIITADLPTSLNLFCAPTISFIAINITDGKKTTLEFQQPIWFRFFGKKMIIQVTILEKNIGSYLGKNFITINNGKSEELTIEEIRLFLAPFFSAYSSDLNKGIKYLLNKDIIDCREAKFKKAKSTSTEIMDEEFTFKKTYPELFKEFIKSPIRKCLFRYLYDDEKMIEHFSSDPSIGEISIPTFPKNEIQIDYVITQILSNN